LTIPNAEHFFEQAERLAVGIGPGAIRQADLRRSISSAYSGVFHALITAAANGAIGRSKRASAEYALAYRSIEHRTLRELCGEVAKPAPSTRHRPFWPDGGFGADLKTVAEIVLDLQRRRHRADYDPLLSLKRSEALVIASVARTAVRRFSRAPAPERAVFLAFLLFPPR